jgi:hypothetical protein
MFFVASANLLSDKYDSIAAKARKAKGKKVILCSPEGKEEGSLAPGKALAQLKRGMTLKFIPGDYPAELTIEPNNVIIESESGKKCGVDLKIIGKKCIVRNLCNYMEIDAEKDIIIVDSAINRLTIRTNSERDRMVSTVYNSAIGDLDVDCWGGRSKNDLSLKYCAIVGCCASNYSTISIDGSATISFDKCVLFSPCSLFSVYKFGSKSPRVALKNSIFYSDVSLGKTRKSRSKVNTCYSDQKIFIARNLKEFKKICRTVINGSKLEKPLFKGEAKRVNIKGETSRCMLYYYFLTPDSYTLADNSPGKDMEAGINSVNEEGFPAPPGSEKKVAKKKK